MLSLVFSPAGLLTPDGMLRTTATRREAVTLAAGAGLSGGSLLNVRPAAAAEASQLVRTPLALPRIGLGAWAWGDTLFWGYDQKKDDELQEVFDYAVSKGVTFFDTAEVYGLGRSEKLLGQFASRNPDAANIQVATKFAALPWRTKPGDVLEAAKRSTDRLGRPIDLYQIHFPNAWANEAYWDGLGDCVDQGLIKAAGVSNYGVEALRACHAKLKSRNIPLSSNQIQVSLIYPYALNNGLVDACKELDVGVLAYSPIGLGMLAGKFALPDKLPDGPRKVIAQTLLEDPNFDALISTMRDVGKSYDAATPAQIAIAWCTAKGLCAIPGVSPRHTCTLAPSVLTRTNALRQLTIRGTLISLPLYTPWQARTLSQAKSNIAAAQIRLGAQDVARLDQAAALIKPAIAPEASPFPKKDVFTGMTMFDS